MKLLTAAAAITTCLLMSGNVMAQNIQIKVDGKAYAGGLNGNDAAKDFAAKLPLKLKFEDFGSTERISYLPQSLNLGAAILKKAILPITSHGETWRFLSETFVRLTT